jgi:hypothetical protein
MRGDAVPWRHVFRYHSHVPRSSVLRINLHREERTWPGSKFSSFASVLCQDHWSRLADPGCLLHPSSQSVDGAAKHN